MGDRMDAFNSELKPSFPKSLILIRNSVIQPKKKIMHRCPNLSLTLFARPAALSVQLMNDIYVLTLRLVML